MFGSYYIVNYEAELEDGDKCRGRCGIKIGIFGTTAMIRPEITELIETSAGCKVKRFTKLSWREV